MTTFPVTGASCHTTFNSMKSDVQTQLNKNISLLWCAAMLENTIFYRKVSLVEKTREPPESVNLFLHVFLCLKVISTMKHYIKLLLYLKFWMFIWTKFTKNQPQLNKINSKKKKISKITFSFSKVHFALLEKNLSKKSRFFFYFRSHERSELLAHVTQNFHLKIRNVGNVNVQQ